ncbi:MAG: hypothetical protein D6757_00880 [Alphaproteobacteria bacterium]|nr:MAG: hypothetical protein D6757_00880 [Alphaproteobacteria bacterium]
MTGTQDRPSADGTTSEPRIAGIAPREFHRRRRHRSLILALLLAGFVVLVFFATLAKLRGLAP